MRFFKRVLTLCTASAIVLSMVACGTPPASSASTPATNSTAPSSSESTASSTSTVPAEKVVVTFAMMAFANEVDGWTAMINEANKLLAPENIEIQIQKVPGTGWPEYYQKVVTQMAGGKSPDIGRIAESFMPMLIGKEQVLDLTDKINGDLDMSAYYEKTFENSAYHGGKYYGVPSGINYYVMYYNKNLFDKAGIAYPSADWSSASSFDEIRTMAQKLTTGEGGGKTYGFSAGPYLAALGMWSTSIGGNNVFDAGGAPTVNDATTKRVLQWFDHMLRTDYSMPRPTDTKVMSAFDMFKAGRIGMIIDGTWWLGGIKDIKDFPVGIAAVPAGDGGTAYSSQFVDSFVIFKGTKHPEESWKALKAIASTEGFKALADTGVGGIPVAKSVANTVIDASLGSAVDEAGKQSAMDAMNHTVKVPYNEYYQEADQKINSVMDEWLLGKITSDEYADNVQKILTDYAAKAAKQ